MKGRRRDLKGHLGRLDEIQNRRPPPWQRTARPRPSAPSPRRGSIRICPIALRQARSYLRTNFDHWLAWPRLFLAWKVCEGQRSQVGGMPPLVAMKCGGMARPTRSAGPSDGHAERGLSAHADDLPGTLSHGMVVREPPVPRWKTIVLTCCSSRFRRRTRLVVMDQKLNRA